MLITKFGKALRVVRIDKNISQRDMAKAINVTPALLSAVEVGKRRPTAKLIAALCAEYGFNNDELTALASDYDGYVSIALEDIAPEHRDIFLKIHKEFPYWATDRKAALLKIIGVKK